MKIQTTMLPLVALLPAFALMMGGEGAMAQSPAAPGVAPAGAPAAAAAKKASKDDRKMTMEAVSEADFKKIEGGPLLLAAYAVVWVLFMGALLFTFVRLRRVGAQVARLQSDLERGSDR